MRWRQARQRATGLMLLIVVGVVAAVSQACGGGSGSAAATPTARPLPSRVAASGTPDASGAQRFRFNGTPRAFGIGLLQTVAGVAAACGGQWERAEEHYQTALRQAHDLPYVMEQPEVRRWYARMLIDRNAPGDRDKAGELLTEAIAMYRRIGMPKHVEMAEALMGGI